MPNPKILHKQKHPLPELLEYFPEETTLPWLRHCIENLADLTVKMARNHLVTPLIPSAAARTSYSSSDTDIIGKVEAQHELDEQRQEEANNSTMQQNMIGDCLLWFYLESPISLSTTWRWLRQLGFTYDTRKKSLFVDCHEWPNVIVRRDEFCALYLVKLEPHAHRRIQDTAKTVEEWKREKKISEDHNQGYNYITDDNKNVVELHDDDLDYLHEHAATMGFSSWRDD